ncbi:MAG: protease inhibitor I9 family protein, partial [Candidatus Woesearchaeota archaeon]
YRGFLIEKSKEFFQANTSKARELMDKLGIEYRCMHIVKMFAADLTKDQYEIIKRSEEIESIIADRPLNLFKP